MAYCADKLISSYGDTKKTICTESNWENHHKIGGPYTTGHREVLPTFKSSPLVFIWRAGLIVSKPMKQSTGILVPHTLIDSSFWHLFTRTRSPLSVTWRQLHRTIVWEEQETYIYLCHGLMKNTFFFFFPPKTMPPKGYMMRDENWQTEKFVIWMRHKLQLKIKTPCCIRKGEFNPKRGCVGWGAKLN